MDINFAPENKSLFALLPLEVLLMICRHCSDADISHLMRTCKTYHSQLQTALYHHNIKYSGSSFLFFAARTGKSAAILPIITMLEIPSSLDLTIRATHKEIGFTPLLIAIHRGHQEVAEHLISLGGPQLLTGYDTFCPLTLALAKNDHKTVGQLMANGVDIDNGKVDNYDNPLFEVCASGNHRMLSALLRSPKLSLEYTADEYGLSPLDLAVASGCHQTVGLLLQHSRPGDYRWYCAGLPVVGDSPLMQAVELQNVKIIEALITHGFTVDPVDLGRALVLGNEAAVSVLLHGGIPLATARWAQYTALACAARGGLARFVAMLLGPADEQERKAASFCAATYGHYNVADLIWKPGDNVTEDDYELWKRIRMGSELNQKKKQLLDASQQHWRSRTLFTAVGLSTIEEK